MLVEATLSGGKEAFETLVERYHRRIFGLALLLVRDASAAEDITQETFLRAYRSLSTCKQPDRFVAWISEIARNCSREWFRARERTHASLETLPGEDWGSELLDDVAQERESRLTELERAVETLPGEMRQIVLMKYKEGKTCVEIAKKLGKGTNTVAKTLSRAYEKLEQELKKHEL